MGPRDRCAIYGCLSNSHDHKGMRFFDYPPPGTKMYTRWLEKCPKSAEIIKSRSRPVVCAKHFDMKILPYKRLDPEAVPTLFLEPTPEFIEAERLKREKKDNEARMRQLLDDVVLEWIKRAKHYPDIGHNCTTWNEMYQTANRVRELLGANMYLRTEVYWLRKFRGKYMSQLAQIDPASAKKTLNLRDIVKELAPDVKILSEDEVAALRKKERDILIENQKKKNTPKPRRPPVVDLLRDESRLAEEAKRVRMRKLIDEIVLEWTKRAKHYPDTVYTCTTWNETCRVANRIRELLGANSYFKAGTYWVRKFRGANIQQLNQKDPTAANKSLELRDIIKELAPEVKILSEEEIAVLQKKEAEAGTEKITKRKGRQKRKAEGSEESRMRRRAKKLKPFYEENDMSGNSSADSVSTDRCELVSEDGGMNLDDGSPNAVGIIGSSLKEAEQIVKQERQDSEEIPLDVALDEGQSSDTLGDDISKLCEKIKSEFSDSIEVHLIEYDSDTEDNTGDNCKQNDAIVKEEPLSDSPEEASEQLEGVQMHQKIKSEFNDSIEMYLIDDESETEDNMGKNCKGADQIVKEEPLTDSEPHEDFNAHVKIKSEDSDSNKVDDSVNTEDDLGNNCKDADQIGEDVPVIKSCEEALEYMKPLEDFALQRENYRLIGVLTAIEKFLNELKKTREA